MLYIYQNHKSNLHNFNVRIQLQNQQKILMEFMDAVVIYTQVVVILTL